MHLHQRVLLAWTQGRKRGWAPNRKLALLQDTQDEPGLLGEEDREEQGAGRGGAAEVGQDGMALYHHLGVRTEGCSA